MLIRENIRANVDNVSNTCKFCGLIKHFYIYLQSKFIRYANK